MQRNIEGSELGQEKDNIIECSRKCFGRKVAGNSSGNAMKLWEVERNRKHQ